MQSGCQRSKEPLSSKVSIWIVAIPIKVELEVFAMEAVELDAFELEFVLEVKFNWSHSVTSNLDTFSFSLLSVS